VMVYQNEELLSNCPQSDTWVYILCLCLWTFHVNILCQLYFLPSLVYCYNLSIFCLCIASSSLCTCAEILWRVDAQWNSWKAKDWVSEWLLNSAII
jgi:hypothetical protein